MKQRLKIAARPSTPKNLSRNHYTSLGFGHVYPVYCEELPNNSKVTLKPRNFSRVAPQFLPNLGTINMKMHAFYVPFSLVWNHYNNFQVGLPSWNSKGSQIYKYVPTLCDCDFTSLFTTSANYLTVPGTGSNFDFFVVTGTPTQPLYNYYKFTAKGKYFYHVLNALGYNFNFVSWTAYADFADYLDFNNPYSILPLCSFFKAYLDYFIPSQLQPSSHLHILFQKLHELTATECTSLYFIDTSVDNLRQNICTLIMEYVDELYYYYQNNYFTSAWMYPNAVVPGLNNIGNSNDYPVINSISQQHHSQNSLSIPSGYKQPLTQNNYSVSNPSIVPPVTADNVNAKSFTADGINVLQKFARFIKRSNFAGARSVERLLSIFGIRITDFEAGMSTYLGSDTLTLQQTDITVTGNNAEAGDMAGKGWFASKENTRVFKCDADQYGFVFVTACLETPSMYVDGVRRRNRHIQPLDFYNPDFDGTTMQAIAGDELIARNLYLNPDSAQAFSSQMMTAATTFGYQLRYNEFKNSIDDISGDFCVPSLRGNIDNFILPRRLYDYIGVDELMHVGGNVDDNVLDSAYSPDIQSGSPMTPVVMLKADDAVQFNRIFKDTDGFADPVFSVFIFDVVVNNSVIPLDTSAELDGRGKELEFESNGVHV